MVSFIIVFTKDVLHIIIDLSVGECDLFLPARVQRFLNMTNCSSKFLSHGIMTIFHFSATLLTPHN